LLVEARVLDDESGAGATTLVEGLVGRVAHARGGGPYRLLLRALVGIGPIERARRLLERSGRALHDGVRQELRVERRREVESPCIAFAVLHDISRSAGRGPCLGEPRPLRRGRTSGAGHPPWRRVAHDISPSGIGPRPAQMDVRKLFFRRQGRQGRQERRMRYLFLPPWRPWRSWRRFFSRKPGRRG